MYQPMQNSHRVTYSYKTFAYRTIRIAYCTRTIATWYKHLISIIFMTYCITSYDTGNYASMFEVMFSCLAYGILMDLMVLRNQRKNYRDYGFTLFSLQLSLFRLIKIENFLICASKRQICISYNKFLTRENISIIQ